MNHDCPAPAAQGFSIRDVTLQLVSPELRQLLQHGQSIPEQGPVAVHPRAPITARSMPEELLAIKELPSLLRLHPDDILEPQPLTTQAASRWKKGNVAVTANRFLRGMKVALASNADEADPGNEADLGTPTTPVAKKRRSQRKVRTFTLLLSVRATTRPTTPSASNRRLNNNPYSQNSIV